MVHSILIACAMSALMATACVNKKSQAEPRSPHLDYGREPPRTADDQIVGADNVPPGDKLQQGPHAGSDGLQPAAGWAVDKKGIRKGREVKGAKAAPPKPVSPAPSSE